MHFSSFHHRLYYLLLLIGKQLGDYIVRFIYDIMKEEIVTDGPNKEVDDNYFCNKVIGSSIRSIIREDNINYHKIVYQVSLVKKLLESNDFQIFISI